jgi:hypothetical protein
MYTDDSEFRKGVSELVKAKLEKPKRLGQLAQRWWNEVFYGSLIFDRQVECAPQTSPCVHLWCIRRA